MSNIGLDKLWGYSNLERTGLPKIEELAGYLKRPLPFQLQFDEDVTIPPRIFVEGGPKLKCYNLGVVIQYVLNQFSRSVDSSVSKVLWGAYYHPLFRMTIQLCQVYGLDLSLVRPQLNQTGTRFATLHPDIILHCYGLVLFRGEEKRAGVQMEVPINELTTKMRIWNPMMYADLPYILGYATSGPTVQFVAIDRHLSVHKVLSIASINFQPNEAIKAFYNLSFLMYKMYTTSKRMEPPRLMPFDPHRSEKRTLTLLDDRIRRSIRFEQCHDAAEFNRLVDIYTKLQQLNQREVSRTNLQNVLRLDVINGEIIVELDPIGLERKPSNEKEVRKWLRDTLNGLKHWHECGYCHGDIDWRNIVHIPSGSGSGYWVLIDIDEAHKPNTTIIHWRHPFKGQELCFYHDLFQVGKMMKSLKIALPEQLLNFQSVLLAANKTSEQTAKVALEVLGQLITLNEQIPEF